MKERGDNVAHPDFGKANCLKRAGSAWPPIVIGSSGRMRVVAEMSPISAHSLLRPCEQPLCLNDRSLRTICTQERRETTCRSRRQGHLDPIFANQVRIPAERRMHSAHVDVDVTVDVDDLPPTTCVPAGASARSQRSTKQGVPARGGRRSPLRPSRLERRCTRRRLTQPVGLPVRCGSAHKGEQRVDPTPLELARATCDQSQEDKREKSA
jgi:hypothetical protein